jgi:hypothetical protein
MRRRALFLLWTLAGCYSPHPVEGGFRCEVDQGLLCPEGLVCNRASGLCVTPQSSTDAGVNAIDFSLDAGIPLSPRSCDDRVRAGAFSNLTNLSVANTNQAETSLSLTPDGKRLYFLRAGALYTAAIDDADHKALTGVAAVTVTGGPDALNGGTIATDGSYWFSGTKAGTTRLYSGALTSPSALMVSSTTHLPQATACAFFDPVFAAHDPAGELYLTYPLTGCGQASYIAEGAADKNLGAFFSALMGPGYRGPSLLPSGLTLLVTSTDSGRLAYSERPSLDVQWTGPNPVPLDALGAPSGGDVQAVVSPGCTTLYLVADRAGGQGATDLWAADISPN